MNQGIKKGKSFRAAPGNYMDSKPVGIDKKEWRNIYQRDVAKRAGGRSKVAAFAAVIPPELSSCVADYAERILEGNCK